MTRRRIAGCLFDPKDRLQALSVALAPSHIQAHMHTHARTWGVVLDLGSQALEGSENPPFPKLLSEQVQELKDTLSSPLHLRPLPPSLDLGDVMGSGICSGSQAWTCWV